jgi:23S rRNA (pseudouridine1915-N3)-methyltransferase
VQLHIISVGTRMPDWVREAGEEYRRRMPPHLRWKLREIAPLRRGKGADVARLLRDEGQRILAALPRDCHVIALERTGDSIDSESLAAAMVEWMGAGRDVALLIGGPEGLSPDCLKRADKVWSLSALTMAHPVVRVVLAEQLYRAWSIAGNRPYHRGGQP